MKFHEYFNLLVLIVALANASAADKGDGDLLKVLAKERKQMSNIFQQENAELRRDDHKLRERDEKLRELGEKLHDRIDKLTERMGKQNQQISKLHGKNDMQNEEISKLHGKNDKLQHQNEKLKNEMTRLREKLQRQSDPEINDLQQGLNHDRQKDQQNQSSEFDQRIKQSIRQEDVHSELKKMIKTEIDDYMINERICVSGEISGAHGDHTDITTRHDVDFGYTFPRTPTVSVATSHFENWYGDTYYFARLTPSVTEVTTSSAKISVVCKDLDFSVSWIACL